MSLVKSVEELSKFKLAVDAAYDCVVITDPDGMILYANSAIKRITGFTPQATLGKKAWTKELWGGLYEKLWKTIKHDKKVFSGEVKNKRKDGTLYNAFHTITPILNEKGNLQFFMDVQRDITREKEVDRAKTEFISLVSHQLQTPLTAINWYAEMLLSGDVGRVTEDQSSYLAEVYKESKRMSRLVSDLLNVSRLEIGGVLVEPIPAKINLLIADIIKESKFVEKEKEVPVLFAKPKEEIELAIDADLFRQVLRNLISNATRYCSEQADAEIKVRLEKQAVGGIDSLVISVMDNGIGIPKEEQHRIFEKFFRAGNAEKASAGGTGLGLYICKMVVENWGGKIWFESEEGKGATFYATIPLTGMVSKKGEKKLA